MNSTINLGNHPNLKIMSHEIYRTNTKALICKKGTNIQSANTKHQHHNTLI